MASGRRPGTITVLRAAALLVAAAAAAAAASQYPGFSLASNALSDLGNPRLSPAAAIFNVGLAVSGFLVVVDAISDVVNSLRVTGLCLAAVGLLVQLVGVLDETYGGLHGLVSVLLFSALVVTSLAAAFQAGVRIGFAAAGVVVLSWVSYWALLRCCVGEVVPEVISLAAASAAYLAIPAGNRACGKR